MTRRGRQRFIPRRRERSRGRFAALPAFRTCRALPLGLAILMMAACSTVPSYVLPPSHDIAADPRMGVVVGSVGSLSDTTGSPPWREWSLYRFASTDGSGVSGSVTSAFAWNPFYMFGSMPLCADDGLAEECGHLFALLLPAGEYEFTDVSPAMMERVGSSLTAGWAERLTGFRFTVQAGTAVYLGNLRSRICVGGGRRRGVNVAWSAVGDVADMSARDLPLLRAAHPPLRAAAIESRVLPGRPWTWHYREEEGYVPAHPWPEPCASPSADQIRRYLLRGD